MKLERRKLTSHYPSVATEPEHREWVDKVIEVEHVKIADLIRTAVLFYLQTHYQKLNPQQSEIKSQNGQHS